jgi:predicted dehydrogenase
MKILIAGFGSIGRRHFRNLISLGERDIIFLRSKRSTLPDDEIAAYPVETTVAAALAHHPDVVIVSNPTSLHLDIAIPAADEGCHLFIEKPVSHSMERVDQLQAAVERSGIKVLVGFQFRYHPQLQQIVALLAANKIGRPVSVRVHWGEYLPGWHPWEDHRKGYSARKDLGGGVVLTLCHPLDYLRWLLGDVSEIWAFTSKVKELEITVDANAEIGLLFRSGVIGSLHLDFIQSPPTHQLEIIGIKGTIRWDNVDGVLRVFQTSSKEPEVYMVPENFERNHLFLNQMEHLLAVVRGEARSRCSLSDGISAQQIAMAALESGHSKRIMRW